MNLINKIRCKIDYLKQERYVLQLRRKLTAEIENSVGKKTIYYFCTPTHSNLGDQAQYLCWLNLMKEWYPEYKIISIPYICSSFQNTLKLHEAMGDEDLIIIHSGYLIFDNYANIEFVLDIVRDFYDKHIVILPQTVNIVSNWYREVVKRTFNAHKNITLFCRDEVSFGKAQEWFPNIEMKLLPDVVTSLIGNPAYQFPGIERDGILLCMRDDLEKLYTNEQIEVLKKQFNGVKTSIIDTTIDARIWEWDINREVLIVKTLSKMAQAKVVITDRYHGTIFSQVVNTPVVVISSTDHKLISGVKWFPMDKFDKNICFANDLTEAFVLASEILNRNGKVYENPAWFKNQYYSTKVF